jgi:signal transduction histidine kinase/ligand-binding sensor domain-containing protein
MKSGANCARTRKDHSIPAASILNPPKVGLPEYFRAHATTVCRILSAAMQRFYAVVLWLLLCAAACVGAAPATPSSYTRRVWQASDGLPEQTVQAFAQTPDGYLWIGTTGGLVRFDGAQFTVIDRQNTPALHENSVFCLTVARDGALWIGTEGGGLVRYAHGQFRSWTTREGLSNDFVRIIAEDANGVIWAGTDNGLLRLEGDHFVRVDGTSGIPALAVHAIYFDRVGRLWAGGSKLLWLAGDHVTEYTLRGEGSQNRVKSIIQTADGSMWVGTVSGLNRMAPGRSTFDQVGGITGTVRVLFQASDRVLWIGTIGQGAFEWDAGKLTQITAPASLPSNTVLNFFEDSEKNFWIGTQAGMVRLTRAQVSIVPLPKANDSDFGTIYEDRDGSFWIGSTLLFEMRNGVVTPRTLPGIADAHVRNVYRTRSGALWVGTDGDGVYRIVDGRTLHLTARDGLSNNFVRAMTQDRDGSVWVAADEGVNHIVDESTHTRIVTYQMRDGLAYFSTRALLEDRYGDLWIGTDRGLSHMHEGRFLSDAVTSALAQMKIWAIHEDSDGGIWFGTRNNGLYRYRDGRLAHFSADDGLAGNAVYQILEDRLGHLWMSGPNGISLLNRHELDAQAETFPRHLALTFYSTGDMVANIEIYGGTQSSGCITAGGDVWFPSNFGPIHILPAHHAPLPPPPLRIQSVLADGFIIPLTGPIVLRPSVSRLQFAFAPIRLRSQGSLRFCYRLDGFEKDWSIATQARTADYTNLPAGDYTFRVQTFELDNPASVSEASIALVKQPFFYRTWWFLALCMLLIALLTYGAYQYRVRHVRARFEAVLEERSRLAREMHDTVIQGCTGVSALLEALSMNGSKKEETTPSLMDFARVQLRTTIEEARDAIWNLHQTDGEADHLGEKLESMARQIGGEFQLPIAYSMHGNPFGISHPVAHDLLMVAREGIFNAALHGHPAHIDVTLTYRSRELILSLSDDGCGFDPQQAGTQNGHHFGLRGMRERIERSGGKFRLSSEAGNGVQIEIHLPRRGTAGK